MGLWQVGSLAALALALFLHPAFSPIRPVAFLAADEPAWESPFALNSKLRELERHFTGLVDGPEDILQDSEGNLYCSNEDGTIRKLWANGSMSILARVGGRPLGMEWLEKDKSMVVCEPTQGLLLVNVDGSYRVLATHADGVRFRFPNNVAVSRSGAVYFSDVSFKFGYYNQTYELLEARPNGRLIKFDPATNFTETVLGGLHFPNGVAISADEDFILIAECTRYLIRKVYLKGPKAGSSEIFVDNLPGMPDNINTDARGQFWVALFMRWRHAGMVMALDPSGNVTQFWMDPQGDVAQKVTTARVFGNRVYMGFIEGDFLASLPLVE